MMCYPPEQNPECRNCPLAPLSTEDCGHGPELGAVESQPAQRCASGSPPAAEHDHAGVIRVNTSAFQKKYSDGIGGLFVLERRLVCPMS